MALADFDLRELGRETTQPVGVISGATHYELDGAVAEHNTISAVLADQGESIFVVRNNATPPDYEIFLGRYHSSTNSVEVVTMRRSSASGSSVDWPADTTCDIYIDVDGTALVDLVNPYNTPGVVCLTSAHTFAYRILTINGGISLDFLAWTFPSGAAGNPELRILYAPVRRSGGTDAQRTIDTPTLSGSWAKITSDPWELRGSGGAGDVALKMDRVATQDYTAQIGRAGALSNVLCQADDMVGFLSGRYFESGEILPTVAQHLATPHGLGARPRLFMAVFRCKAAEFGYQIDDEVALGSHNDGTNDGITVYADATNIGVSIQDSGFRLIGRSALGSENIYTAANWRIVLRAWK